MYIKRVSIAVAVSALGLAMAPGVAFAAGAQVACGTPAKQAVYSTVVVPGTAAVSHQELEWSSVSEVVERQWHQYLVDSAAKDAVYTTVHHDAVYQTVAVPGTPAHDEQVLDVPAHDQQVLDVPAHDERVLDVPAHDEQVLKTAAYDDPPELVTAAYDEPVMTSPEVTHTEYEFVQKNGNVRWEEDPNWNAQGNSSSGGWVATGESRQTVVTPAVYGTVHHDAVYKTVHHDAVYTTVHHEATYKTVHVDDVYKTVHVDDTYKTVHHDATPDTSYQELVTPASDEVVELYPAVPEQGHWEETWSVESPGAAWSATGATRTVAGETSLVWAAESPGEGWTATGAYRTVEDTPAVPDSSTQVLVSAAVPAGPECGPEPTTGGGSTVVPEPANPASAVPAAAGLAKPAAVNATTELAFTGSDPTLMWLGLGFLLTGIGVSAGYRKVAQQR
jgi:hypothetical protein